MKRLILMLIAISGLLSPLLSHADCNQLYPNNTKLVVNDTVELCNTFYASRYDILRNRAVLTAEVIRAKQTPVKRIDSFRADSRFPTSTPADYTNSGFDKGHMTPAGDSNTIAESFDTFLMTNMTPQKPLLNRGAWKELEESIRSQVKKEGVDVKVITGALYEFNPATIGRTHKIPIPNGYYKVAYFKSGLKAYYADNKDDAVIRTVTIDYIRQISHINLP